MVAKGQKGKLKVPYQGGRCSLQERVAFEAKQASVSDRVGVNQNKSVVI